jgi:hypothetical protein
MNRQNVQRSRHIGRAQLQLHRGIPGRGQGVQPYGNRSLRFAPPQCQVDARFQDAFEHVDVLAEQDLRRLPQGRRPTQAIADKGLAVAGRRIRDRALQVSRHWPDHNAGDARASL